MATIDYKEKYEQALERARQFSEKPYLEDSAVTVEYIFPELAESEDVRIRKGLITIITDFESLYLQENYALSKEDAIAWLEKQGEQKPVNIVKPKFNVGDIIKCGLSTLEICELNFDRCFYELRTKEKIIVQCVPFIEQEKWELVYRPNFKVGDTVKRKKDGLEAVVISVHNGVTTVRCADWDNTILDKEWELVEQKPADKAEPKFKIGDTVISTISNNPYYITKVCNGHYLTDVGCVIMFNAQDNFELVEQKPTAWSEEDETALGDALWAIKQAKTIAKDENDMGNLWYAERWLKSIKDRCAYQPKKEWSEKDELMYESIIDTLKLTNGAAQIKIDWLKSLRPQPHWKPSDEQMNNK